MTWRSPGGNCPRQLVFHFKSEGGIVLWSFIYFQRQCVIHFKSEGHWLARGDCVIVSPLFSMSMCHSFQKRVSPVGFLLSTCRRRLFGWLWFFKFKFFNFFAGFFNGQHTGFNFGVRGVRTRGVTCASVACIPVTHSVPWHCKCFLYPILAHAKGAFCARAHFAPGTQTAKTLFWVRKCRVLRVDCFASENAKTPFCVRKRPFLRQQRK